MTGLNLLSEYDGLSDEEVDNDNASENIKVSRLPAPNLPNYGKSSSISRTPNNDPTRHQHRTRSIPHEPGNWATHVGIQIEITHELMSYLDSLRKAMSTIELHSIDEPHISLSRLLILRYHWITDFVESVKAAVAAVDCFRLSLSGVSVYVNDEKSRTFLALDVQEGCHVLNLLVNEIDRCVSEYSLPQYYNERRFHLSVFWTLGDRKKELEEIVSQLPSSLVQKTLSERIYHCSCKSGNKSFILPFSGS